MVRVVAAFLRWDEVFFLDWYGSEFVRSYNMDLCGECLTFANGMRKFFSGSARMKVRAEKGGGARRETRGPTLHFDFLEAALGEGGAATEESVCENWAAGRDERERSGAKVLWER